MNKRGRLEIKPITGSDSQVYVPVDVPSQILGKQQKLKSITVTYRVNNTGSRIDDTRIQSVDSTGTMTDLIADTSDRTSTSWNTYTLNTGTPPNINGSISIRFSLIFSGSGTAGEIYVGMINLTIGE